MSSRIPPLSIILFLVDMAIVPISLSLATFLRATVPIGTGGALPSEHVAVPAFVFVIALGCAAVGMSSSGAYDPQKSLRWFNETWRVLWGCILAAFLMAGFLYLSYRELSRLQFVYFFTITATGLLGYRWAFRLVYRTFGFTRPGGRTRILMVGAGELGGRLGKTLLDHSRWGFAPIGYLDDDPDKQGMTLNGLPIFGGIGDLAKVVADKNVDEVWTALPLNATARLEDILRALERMPVRIKVVPDYFSMALVRASAQILSGIPIIGLRDPLIAGPARWAKRAFDFLLTGILLVPLLPVMGLIAAAIKLTSPGPALIHQERAGENGRPFRMLKFRTMVRDAESRLDEVVSGGPNGEVVHKHKDDPRVTPFGRFLRRFSLDELPQLFNVLKGEMSLVGPRPELPWLVDQYDSWQRKRFAVPQGITGWWQTNGRSDKPMHLNTEFDLYYVYNYSLLLDVMILLRTPWVVLRGMGAF